MGQTSAQDDEEAERELRFDVSVDRLRQFLDPINAVVDEAKLRFDHEGLSVNAVDPANVAMLEAELYHTAFKRFEVSEGVIGINISALSELLEAAPEEADLRFELGDYKKFTVSIGHFEWTEGWIDPGSIRREPDLPDLDLPARFTFPGAEFKQIVEYARFVKRGGHTRLIVDPDRWDLVACSEGDTDDGRYCLAEEDGLIIHEIGPADSLYSNDYLADLADGIPEGVDVTMELGEEYPFRMQFGIDEGQVEYMQAPRIMSD